MSKQQKPKIVLGKKPEVFAPETVDVTGPDGAEMCIPAVVFQYRTRKEFGDLVTASFHDREVPKTEGGMIDWGGLAGQQIGDNAAYLAQCVQSWGLDVEPTREALEQLGNELPAAITSLKRAYSTLCNEGRLGN